MKVLLAASTLLAVAGLVGHVAAQPVAATVNVCFVPAQRCTGEIVNAIGTTRQAIRLQAYGFTSPPILQALTQAKARGVDVQVILDKINDHSTSGRSRYSGATVMANAGIPVAIDYKPAIAHNKVIVIDGHLVVGGSFNYTLSADTRNAENVTFIDSPAVASRFLANWQSRQAESRPYSAAP